MMLLYVLPLFLLFYPQIYSFKVIWWYRLIYLFIKSQFLYKNHHLIWRCKSKFKFLLKNRYTYSFVFIFRYYCCFCCHVYSGWAVLISCPDLLFVLKERLPFQKKFVLTINLVFRLVCMLFFIKFFWGFHCSGENIIKIDKKYYLY